MQSEKTFKITTLGCKMNQYESSGMEQILLNEGYRLVREDEEAALHIINTCTVTAKTDTRSRQAIRKAKQASPSSLLLVTGCYAQRFPDEVSIIEGVDHVLGNNEKVKLAAIISSLASGSGVPKIQVSDIRETHEFQEFFLTCFSDYTRAFVKIQDGCNCHCAYCAVTFARGPGRSLEPLKVRAQIETLLDHGYKEIVLTGINLGSYGQDLKPRLTLADFLTDITTSFSGQRLRLSSIEPQEWTDQLIDVISKESKICPHFHIPLQSGSNVILKKMERKYDRSGYESLINKIFSAMPSAGIGADVMVGFPGETETEFGETQELIENLPLSYLHVFGYSPRPGTPAYSTPLTCSVSEKKDRVRIIRQLGEQKKLAFRKAHLGQELSVLILSKRASAKGLLIGLSENYLNILFGGSDRLFNTFQKVKITHLQDDQVFGARVHGPPRPLLNECR
ncbi:tRNA (N(6)-L-threonylcarbamoyladenosine(37)-C(2))-methylthiotransferase MtaB [candidate division CSSED10-310 bacterium]|uniref:tRNA (N(6)-L-threonylcarbamoyladenosine(37)-C(2))-methylthiotransferase n=1 Tax=candidate division CSSED10-310 bacterium TaxID=2855610 RepID=A0ABV6Z1R5_UNCC1